MPELSSGATSRSLRAQKHGISPSGGVPPRAANRLLPAGSAAFCSGDGDLAGVEELEGKLLLV